MVNTPSAVAARTRPNPPSRRRLLPLLLAAVALCALAPGALTAAQSGRRKTEPSRRSPVPTPTPAAASEPQGESESQPRAAQNTSIVATFVVYEDANLDLNFSVNGSQRDIVSSTFLARLRQSPSVEVTAGGEGTRSTARDRARKERVAYTVHLQLEEDLANVRGDRREDALSRRDPGIYSLRVSVYSPGDGGLKYSQLIQQRPYRPTTRVGGIPVPVPVGPERIPGEYQLAQVARDAADRVLAHFDIPRPPDN